MKYRDDQRGGYIPLHCLNCPFCGEEPTMEPWHGGGPAKHMISCENEECPANPSVTGETPQEAVDRWDTRRDE